MSRWAWAVTAVLALAGWALGQEEGDRVVLPDTLPGRQMAWVIEVINGREIGDPAERFSDRFREMHPPEKLADWLGGMRKRWWEGSNARPIKIESSNDTAVAVVLTGEKAERAMSAFLAVDDATGKIAGLTISPAFGMGEGGGGASWDEMEGDLGKIKGGVTFGCYEIAADPTDPGGARRLAPIHEFFEDKPQAIAGGVRLFILAAAARSISEGKAAWDQMVALKERWKSVPPGRLMDAADGAEFSLADLAHRMMREGDFTGADVIVRALGRAKVEGMFTEMARDGRNVPLLLTRDFYAMKLAPDQGVLEEYAACDEIDRRDMLENDVAALKPSLMSAKGWTTPRAVDTVEWFASAREMCRAWLALADAERGEGMGPLTAAMDAGVGLRLDRERWPVQRFVGGAEPGVQMLSMLMKRSDERWFTIGVAWNNKDKALEQERLVELFRSGVKILDEWGGRNHVGEPK